MAGDEMGVALHGGLTRWVGIVAWSARLHSFRHSVLSKYRAARLSCLNASSSIVAYCVFVYSYAHWLNTIASSYAIQSMERSSSLVILAAS